MNTVYDKCSKQMYDTVKQLMKLAEENNSDGFFDLTEASKAFFYAEYSLFETAVAAGLMARNKADILDNFLTAMDIRHFRANEILCHIAGLLIRERKCREAVKRFIVRIPRDKISEKEYILFSAAMADDIEIFKLLYDADNYTYNTDILLLGGIFKSKKVLDHLIDSGNDFIYKKTFCTNLSFMTCNNYDPLLRSTDKILKNNAEDDLLFKWLENIHSMYLSNEDPETAYENIMEIARNTVIIINRENYIGRYNHSYDTITKNMILREMNIMLAYGRKTNDLTYFIPSHSQFEKNSAEYNKYMDILMKITGDEPFIAYRDWLVKSEDIDILPEKLKNKLTVRLINNFNMSDIENLHGSVKLKIDIQDPRTVNHLSFMLMPLNVLVKERQETQQKLVSYLIDNGYAAADKITEIAASVKNNDILKMLFNYENEKKASDNQAKSV